MYITFQNDPLAYHCLFRVNIYLIEVAGESGMITPGWQDRESRGYTVP